MALDPSIALAYRPPQVNVDVPSPIQQFGQVLTLRNMMQQGQLGQLGLQSKMLELQQLQQEMQEQQDYATRLRQFQQRTAPTAASIPLQTAPAVIAPGASLGSLMAPQGTASGSIRPDAKSGPYVTTLAPPEEAKFQAWVKTNHIPFDPSPTADYDMRGFWRSMMAGQSTRSTENLHFPDTFKTPYHQSFSNESMYATADAPHWDGNRLLDKTGKVVFDESQGSQAPAPQAGTPGAPLSTLASPSAALPATGGQAGSPWMLGMSPGEFLSRFPLSGAKRLKEGFASDQAQAEAAIKQHDANSGVADEFGRAGIAVRDSKDPATQFVTELTQLGNKGRLPWPTVRQMISDGYDAHKNDVQAFIDKAQNVKDTTDIAKNNLQADLEDQKKASKDIRTVFNQDDYTKFLASRRPNVRSQLPETFSAQIKDVIQGLETPAAQLPKAQLEQIQTDAVKLIGAIRQGPEAASNALAQMSPDSQKAFAGATTEQEVYQRAHPEVIAENLKPTGDFERNFLPAFAARLKNADGTPKTVNQLTPDQKIQAFREFKVDPAQQSLANAQKLLALVQTRIQLSQQPTAEQAQDVAKDLVAHRIAPEQMTQLFSSRGKEGMAFKLQVFNQAKKIDPNFDFEQASAEYQLTKSPGFQNTVRYMDSVQESMPRLIASAKALGNVGVRSINSLINAGKDQFNNINLKKFNVDRLLLADEMAKLLQGGGTGAGTSDAKLAQAEKLLRDNDDPAAIEAALDEVYALIGYRRKALTRGTYFERTGPGAATATVKMKAPDGTVRDIPADQVEHFKSQGATVVQ